MDFDSKNRNTIISIEEMMARASIKHPKDFGSKQSDDDQLIEIALLIKELIRNKADKAVIIIPEDCKRCQEMANMLFNKKQYMLPLATIGVMLFVLGVAITLAALTAFGAIEILNISTFFILGVAAIVLIITSIIAMIEMEKVLYDAKNSINKINKE